MPVCCTALQARLESLAALFGVPAEIAAQLVSGRGHVGIGTAWVPRQPPMDCVKMDCVVSQQLDEGETKARMCVNCDATILAATGA